MTVAAPAFQTLESVTLGDVVLSDAPINPEWVIAGEPRAQAGEWSVSSCGTMSTAVWSCTKGEFRWYYASNEIIQVLEGEVIVRTEDGPPRRLGPGDAALFRANSWAFWEVPEYVRKHAILHNPPPAPIFKLWRGLARIKRLVRPGCYAPANALGAQPTINAAAITAAR